MYFLSLSNLAQDASDKDEDTDTSVICDLDADFDADEASDIEVATRGQASNSVWQSRRKYRITASKCYREASMKPDTIHPTKALKEVFQYNPPCQSKNMVEGVEIEIKILEEYKALVHQKGNIDLTRSVKQCAFFIFDEGIFDALVDNTLLSNPEGHVEIEYIKM